MKGTVSRRKIPRWKFKIYVGIISFILVFIAAYDRGVGMAFIFALVFGVVAWSVIPTEAESRLERISEEEESKEYGRLRARRGW